MRNMGYVVLYDYLRNCAYGSLAWMKENASENWTQVNEYYFFFDFVNVILFRILKKIKDIEY